jgi:DNA-binding XRE family transcriptional regulator
MTGVAYPHPSTVGVKLRSRKCKWGHDKLVCGIDSHWTCRACARKVKDLSKRKVRDRRMAENPRSRKHALDEIPNLEETRQEFGLTSTDFAELAGVHRTSIRLIERGKRKPTRDMARKIVRAVMELRREKA